MLLLRITFALLLPASALATYYSNDGTDYSFPDGDDVSLKPAQKTLGRFRLEISSTPAPLNDTDITDVLHMIELKMSNDLNNDGVNVESVHMFKTQVREFDGATIKAKVLRPRNGNMRGRFLTRYDVENTNNGQKLEQTDYITKLQMEGVTTYFEKDQQIPSEEDLMHHLQVVVHSNDDDIRVLAGNIIIDEIILLWEIENYTLAPGTISSPIPSVVPSPTPSEAPTQMFSGVPTPDVSGKFTQTPTQGDNLTAGAVPSVPRKPQIDDASKIFTFKTMLAMFGGLGAFAIFGGGYFVKRCHYNKRNDNESENSSISDISGGPGQHLDTFRVQNKTEGKGVELIDTENRTMTNLLTSKDDHRTVQRTYPNSKIYNIHSHLANSSSDGSRDTFRDSGINLLSTSELPSSSGAISDRSRATFRDSGISLLSRHPSEWSFSSECKTGRGETTEQDPNYAPNPNDQELFSVSVEDDWHSSISSTSPVVPSSFLYRRYQILKSYF